MSRPSDDSTGESPPSTTENNAAIEQPSAQGGRGAAGRALHSYGVAREDTVWVTECAWCKRVRSASGDWQTPAVASRATRGVQRTHGICPQCARAAAARAEIVDGSAQ